MRLLQNSELKMTENGINHNNEHLLLWRYLKKLDDIPQD